MENYVAIGHEMYCEVRLRGPGVDWHHCYLHYANRYTALLSVSGPDAQTLVNDKPVHNTFLHHGDVIRLGRHVLTFEVAPHTENPDRTVFYRLVGIEGILKGQTLDVAEEEVEIWPTRFQMTWCGLEIRAYADEGLRCNGAAIHEPTRIFDGDNVSGTHRDESWTMRVEAVDPHLDRDLRACAERLYGGEPGVSVKTYRGGRGPMVCLATIDGHLHLQVRTWESIGIVSGAITSPALFKLICETVPGLEMTSSRSESDTPPEPGYDYVFTFPLNATSVLALRAAECRFTPETMAFVVDYPVDRKELEAVHKAIAERCEALRAAQDDFLF